MVAKVNNMSKSVILIFALAVASAYGEVKVRGYVGVSVLGMTTTWTRETKKRTQE